MTTTTLNPAANYTSHATRPGVIARFMNWCESQQPNRLLWLGIALAAHGCILTPVTVMAILLAGVNVPLIVLAISSMGVALVSNLAALPTRITIPLFLFSILIDLGIMVTAAVTGFSLSNAF